MGLVAAADARGGSGYIEVVRRAFATRTRAWLALTVLAFGLGCGARTGLELGSGGYEPDAPSSDASDAGASFDALAVSDGTVEATADGPGADVASEAADGGDRDSSADSTVDAISDSGSDATPDSGGDATVDSGADATEDAEPDGTLGSDGGMPDAESDAPQDSASDALPEDASSDSPPGIDAADGGAPDGGCSPVGSYRCAADGHPQYCQTDGLWSAEDCAFSCSACSGLVGSSDCTNWCTTPGATTCSGGGVETCGPSHHWGAAFACDSNACTGTACSGACTPGAVQCSGNAAQTCTASGTWSAPADCANQTCVAGICTGECSPGQNRFVTCGNCGVEEDSCGASGLWQTGTCAGEGPCAAGTTRSCGASGSSQTCTTSCQWGGCGCSSNCGCTEGATQCDGNSVQTCGDAGAWGARAGCGAAAPFCVGGACVAVPPAQSCATSGPGLTDCGGGGDAGSESCCTTLGVTGGTFNRTYVNHGSGPIGEADPATISDFKLDKYLVTVGRFRQFVSAWNYGTGFVPPGGRASTRT